MQNGRQSPQAGEQPEKAIIDRQIEVRLFACWRMLILRDLVPPVQGSWHAFHRATFARVEGWNAEGKEMHRQSWKADLFVVCHGSGTGASSCAQASRWFLPWLMPSQDFSGMSGCLAGNKMTTRCCRGPLPPPAPPGIPALPPVPNVDPED